MDPVFGLTFVLLASALIFGGASRLNALQVAVLELLSLPVIGVALWRLHLQGALPRLWAPISLLAGIAAIPLLQLVRVPFGVWRTLPGHADLATGLELVGLHPSRLATSLAPDRTLENALALLIPAGVLLGTLACERDQRRMLATLVVCGCVASLLLGIAQITAGDDSPLRFYQTLAPQFASGLFANRNHQALFLLLSLPLLAALLRLPESSREGRSMAMLVASLGLTLVLMVGVVETRSRAGLLLSIPAIVGASAVLWRSNRTRRFSLVPIIVAAVVLAALGAALVLFHAEVLQRFSTPLSEDGRRLIWASTAEAARTFAPFGTGIGSFDRVYPSVENVRAMQFAFVNHAHNDYLEIWLEAGWLGLAALAAFALWFIARSAGAWRAEGTSARLAQAASVMVLLIALHSTSDYPLRTPAIAAVLAFACALLAAPFRREANTSALRETYPP